MKRFICGLIVGLVLSATAFAGKASIYDFILDRIDGLRVTVENSRASIHAKLSHRDEVMRGLEVRMKNIENQVQSTRKSVDRNGNNIHELLDALTTECVYSVYSHSTGMMKKRTVRIPWSVLISGIESSGKMKPTNTCEELTHQVFSGKIETRQNKVKMVGLVRP